MLGLPRHDVLFYYPMRTTLLVRSALALLAFLFSAFAHAQTPQGDVYIDGHGVLRWQKTKREVALFGVNYTAPFAYSTGQLISCNLRATSRPSTKTCTT
jgi:hypothetical protein